MKYKYQPYQDLRKPDGEYICFPLLQATLKHGNQTITLDCLVDSGASSCLFSTDIASLLGIDLTTATPEEYCGIGDVVISGYTFPIKLKIKGFDKWIDVDAGFIDENEMPLLGHSGFFEQYEITFRAYQNRFEIKSNYS